MWPQTSHDGRIIAGRWCPCDVLGTRDAWLRYFVTPGFAPEMLMGERVMIRGAMKIVHPLGGILREIQFWIVDPAELRLDFADVSQNARDLGIQLAASDIAGRGFLEMGSVGAGEEIVQGILKSDQQIAATQMESADRFAF